MPHASNTYFHEGFGRCIYCGSEESLTDEHIIPFSLGGCHVISRASCKGCAVKTSYLERLIARDLWGDARIAYNAPSRRSKRRPSYLMMGNLPMKPAEFPAQFVFYEMPKPGILAGINAEVDTSALWKLRFYGSDRRLQKTHQKHPGKVKVKFRHLPNEFGRLLIKIVYCQALTALTPDDLSSSYQSFIFNDNANVSYLVGAALEERNIEKGIGSHLCNYLVNQNGHLLVVSQVQLFANLSTPVYDVVVGKVSDRSVIERLLPKLDIRDAARRMMFGP